MRGSPGGDIKGWRVGKDERPSWAGTQIVLSEMLEKDVGVRTGAKNERASLAVSVLSFHFSTSRIFSKKSS